MLTQLAIENKNLSKEDTDQLIAGYEEKSSELLNFLSEQIRTQALRLAGKEKTVRYSPKLLKFAASIFIKSQTCYSSVSQVINLPSRRTMQIYKSSERTSSGGSTDSYLKAFHLFGSHSSMKGLLMMDEMKLQSGIVFNSKDHSLDGFEDDELSFNKVCDIFKTGNANPDKAVATSMNLFYLKHETSGFRTTLDRFMMAKGCSGSQLRSQFLSVIKKLETMNWSGRLVICDAGGGNAKFFRLVKKEKTGHKYGAWLTEGECRFNNPCNRASPIYLCHCMTHRKSYLYMIIH